MEHLQSEHVFILKHYFTLKTSAAVYVSNGHPDKAALSKTKIWLVTKFWDAGKMTKQLKLWLYHLQAVHQM